MSPAVHIFDSDGMLINSSENWPTPDIKIADRAYFKAAKSGAATAPVSIELVRGRFSKDWATVIAYRITAANGEFLGLVTRAIKPASFEKFFESLALGDGASISILHRDGTLLGRYPHVQAMIGLNFKNAPVHQQILSKSDHGTMRMISPIDGLSRLASARALTDFPIDIIATTTVSAALADWREQLSYMIAAAGLSVLVIAGMLFFVVRKLSQQHQMEKQRLDTAVNNIPQGLVVYDKAARITVCNERYIEMFGLSPEVAKPGHTMQDLIAHRKETGSFDGDVDEFCNAIMRDVALGKATARSRRRRTAERSRSSTNRWKPAAGSPRSKTSPSAHARRSKSPIWRITTRLPICPIAYCFDEQLEHALKQVRSGEQLAVLYIDIDEFKSVNDALGHSIGDELLKAVADRLRGCLRETDVAARLGGDEFAVIQTAVKNPSETTHLVERIYRAIREPYECASHLITTDASVGIALASGAQHGSGSTAEERGSGNVCRQIRRTPDLSFLQAGHGSAGQGTPRAGNGSAPGDIGRRAGGLLPALRQSARQQDHRLRSPAALAPSRTRHDLARRVHSDRGRDRSDQSAWRMGADDGLCGGHDVAG